MQTLTYTGSKPVGQAISEGMNKHPHIVNLETNRGLLSFRVTHQDRGNVTGTTTNAGQGWTYDKPVSLNINSRRIHVG